MQTESEASAEKRMAIDSAIYEYVLTRSPLKFELNSLFYMLFTWAFDQTPEICPLFMWGTV